jgi:single-stranded-DNA-specific exonuclease
MSRLKKLNRLLPLVAIGTVADCQSIIEPTNRLLVKTGLQILQNKQHNIVGLNELINQSGLGEKMAQGYELTSQDLGFTLSPILNSSGRISHARLSIITLLAGNSNVRNATLIEENQEYWQENAADLASMLIQTNQDRKQMVKDILSEVETEAEKQFQEGNKLLWLEGQWNKGIIGLLASRLVNQYDLPVVVISLGKEE